MCVCDGGKDSNKIYKSDKMVENEEAFYYCPLKVERTANINQQGRPFLALWATREGYLVGRFQMVQGIPAFVGMTLCCVEMHKKTLRVLKN